MSYLRSIRAIGFAVVALALTASWSPPGAAAADPVTVTDYTDPAQAPSWGTRSYWKQPWRSYLDTVPARTLLDAIGINFNVGSKQVASTARLLGESGFKRARIEVGWGSMDYDHPAQLTSTQQLELEAKLRALRKNGIRPLILLNGNEGEPCPVRPVSLRLLKAAPAGATQVRLDPAQIEPGEVVSRRTGISEVGFAAARLIKSVDATGLAVLSKPLAEPLPSGPLAAVTLRFEPFTSNTLPNGATNPRWRTTMDGWLGYVQAITQVAKRALGSEAFDVEIWNELSFGSAFLNTNRYYEPDTEEKPENRLIIEETVKLLRTPGSGVPNVGIGNGFASQSPHGSGIEGIAIDKHPYFGIRYFPADRDRQLTQPLDALGILDGIRDLLGGWHDAFTPTFISFFPEYSISALQTESLIYDLAPYESIVGGEPHGRNAIGPGATDPSPVWVTEVNLDPSDGPISREQLSDADMRRVETKIILRYIASLINKGVSVLDFYAADAGNLSLVDRGFFEAIKGHPGDYPGRAAGGQTMDAVRRLAGSMKGATPIAEPRQLSLRELTDYSGNVQFSGNGSDSYPPLFNRDVFAFLPFQVNSHRFVIPAYVMTMNVVQVYKPGAPKDPARFDLPPERYRMAIGGIDGTEAVAGAIDPLTGQAVPVQIISGNEDEIVVEMEVTDSPRLLTIDEEPGAAEPEPEPEVEPDPDPEVDPVPGERQRPPQVRSPVRTPSAAGPKPSLSIRARGGPDLLRTGHMSVFARCDRSCSVSFGGRLKVGRRTFAMGPREDAPLPASESREAGTRLALGARAIRSARRALDANTPVRIHLEVSAVGDSGETSASRRIKLHP